MMAELVSRWAARGKTQRGRHKKKGERALKNWTIFKGF